MKVVVSGVMESIQTDLNYALQIEKVGYLGLRQLKKSLFEEFERFEEAQEALLSEEEETQSSLDVVEESLEEDFNTLPYDVEEGIVDQVEPEALYEVQDDEPSEGHSLEQEPACYGVDLDDIEIVATDDAEDDDPEETSEYGVDLDEVELEGVHPAPSYAVEFIPEAARAKKDPPVESSEEPVFDFIEDDESEEGDEEGIEGADDDSGVEAIEVVEVVENPPESDWNSTWRDDDEEEEPHLEDIPTPAIAEPALVVANAMEDVPRDIRQFLKRYPNSEREFVLRYFSSKDVAAALRTGKIFSRGSKLLI